MSRIAVFCAVALAVAAFLVPLGPHASGAAQVEVRDADATWSGALAQAPAEMRTGLGGVGQWVIVHGADANRLVELSYPEDVLYRRPPQYVYLPAIWRR